MDLNSCKQKSVSGRPLDTPAAGVLLTPPSLRSDHRCAYLLTPVRGRCAGEAQEPPSVNGSDRNVPFASLTVKFLVIMNRSIFAPGERVNDGTLNLLPHCSSSCRGSIGDHRTFSNQLHNRSFQNFRSSIPMDKPRAFSERRSKTYYSSHLAP